MTAPAPPPKRPSNEPKRKVVVAGATGAVGRRVLHHLLAHDGVARITALVRRQNALPPADKLVISTVDVAQAGSVSTSFPDDVDDLYCCVGTTRKQAGSAEAFRAVDLTGALAIARVARQKGARRLLLVSSMGANPRSGNLYLRTKGELEDAVAGLGYETVVVARPGMLDDEGHRKKAGDKRLGEQVGLSVMGVLAGIIGRQHRYAPIRVDTVARALVRVAFDAEQGGRVFLESDALQRLGADDPVGGET